MPHGLCLHDLHDYQRNVTEHTINYSFVYGTTKCSRNRGLDVVCCGVLAGVSRVCINLIKIYTKSIQALTEYAHDVLLGLPCRNFITAFFLPPTLHRPPALLSHGMSIADY